MNVENPIITDNIPQHLHVKETFESDRIGPIGSATRKRKNRVFYGSIAFAFVLGAGIVAAIFGSLYLTNPKPLQQQH